MTRTAPHIALFTAAATLAAGPALADMNCRTSRLSGDWTLTLSGAFPDTNESPVWVDHLFIACDVSITQSGALSGTCQDMLGASVGEAAHRAITAELRLNRRSCTLSGTATYDGTSVTIEGRAVDSNSVDTGATRVNVVEALAIVDLGSARPVPNIRYIPFEMRLLREPWGGSAFSIGG